MDWMPKRPASAGFSSTLTLAIFTRPACSAAISSRTGASILHGPHHSAQKSTTTGRVDWRTSLSKLVSLISIVVFMFGLRFQFSVYQLREFFGFSRLEARRSHVLHFQPMPIGVADLQQFGTVFPDRKSTRLNSSHIPLSRMPSSA